MLKEGFKDSHSIFMKYVFFFKEQLEYKLLQTWSFLQSDQISTNNIIRVNRGSQLRNAIADLPSYNV